MHPHFSTQMGKDFLPIIENDSKEGRGQSLGHLPFLYDFVACHQLKKDRRMVSEGGISVNPA